MNLRRWLRLLVLLLCVVSLLMIRLVILSWFLCRLSLRSLMLCFMVVWKVNWFCWLSRCVNWVWSLCWCWVKCLRLMILLSWLVCNWLKVWCVCWLVCCWSRCWVVLFIRFVMRSVLVCWCRCICCMFMMV